MGLGVMDPPEDDKGVLATAVPCSICLEAVTDGGDRSTAKLQCGHQFHLDCIGSAFNVKGTMQCPNCRKIQKGNWRFANGHRPFPELSMEDWMHDEELYDLNFSEMPYGVQWCPFSRLAQISSSSEETELSPPVAFHDLLGPHSVFLEPPNTSSAHSCPYIAYLQPLQPSSSSSQVFTENAFDGPTFHPHWNNPPPAIDVPNSHGFATVEVAYHYWDSHSIPSSHSSTAEQASVLSSTTRASRLDSDGLPRAMPPFILFHGSTSRASTSAAPSNIPPYIGNSRDHAHTHEPPVTSHRRSMRGPINSGIWRSGSSRGLAPIGPIPSQSDHSNFYQFAPGTATSRSPQEAEANGGGHFYSSERDHFAHFPLLPVERDLARWGHPPQAPPNGSDPSNWTASRPRHGTERSSSQSRTAHAPWMHPFI